MSTHILKSSGPSGAVFPKRLKRGGRVGIAAPSGAVDPSEAAAGVRALEALGFAVVIPDDVFRRKRYLAGDDRQRAETIVRMFRDPHVDAVLCARGGYGAMRTLSYLDWSVLRQNPKPLIGFSDSTALLNTVVERCGMVVYHGPVLTKLASADGRTVESFLTALTETKPVRLTAVNAEVVQSGRAFGKVFGGNLTTLCHMAGTPFMPEWSGAILFLEDCHEAPYRIDRMLSQMKLGGRFDRVVGIMLGAFTDCGAPDELRGLFSEILGDLGIPVLGGFDIGHGATNLTLPLGAEAILDTATASVTFPLSHPIR